MTWQAVQVRYINLTTSVRLHLYFFFPPFVIALFLFLSICISPPCTSLGMCCMYVSWIYIPMDLAHDWKRPFHFVLFLRIYSNVYEFITWLIRSFQICMQLYCKWSVSLLHKWEQAVDMDKKTLCCCSKLFSRYYWRMLIYLFHFIYSKNYAFIRFMKISN